MDKKFGELPQPNKWDAGHTLAKAGLSAIPVLGGPAAELFQAIVEAPLSRRRSDWMEAIGAALISLEGKVADFQIDKLADDDVFITTVMQASQIAMRNHQREKLDALKNAVLNTALRNEPKEDIQFMFLEFVDAFTPWHLRILRFFQAPAKWAEENKIPYPNWELGSPRTFIRYAFPELAEHQNFYELVTKDLFNKGLLDNPNLNDEMASEGMSMSRTTAFGNLFLSFISEIDE